MRAVGVCVYTHIFTHSESSHLKAFCFWFRFDFSSKRLLRFRVCEVVLLCLVAHKTQSVAAFGRFECMSSNVLG